MAGLSYPERRKELEYLIDTLISENYEWEESESPYDSDPVGALIPHIDLQRGGRIYGGVYRELRKRKKPDAVIVLGTCHQPSGSCIILTDKDFETPLGIVRHDPGLADELERITSCDFNKQEWLHKNEHSVEFQSLFLAKIFPGAKMLPVLCGSFSDPVTGEMPDSPPEDVEEFISAVREIIGNSGRDILVIASSDLAHAGRQFGDEFVVDERDYARIELEDRTLLENFKSGDRTRFYSDLAGAGNRNHICGYAGIYTMIGICEPCTGLLGSYGQWKDPDGTATFAGGVLFGE